MYSVSPFTICVGLYCEDQPAPAELPRGRKPMGKSIESKVIAYLEKWGDRRGGWMPRYMLVYRLKGCCILHGEAMAAIDRLLYGGAIESRTRNAVTVKAAVDYRLKGIA